MSHKPPHKPEPKKPASKPASAKKAATQPRQPVVLPAIVGAALVVPNLTMRAGSWLYEKLRNR